MIPNLNDPSLWHSCCTSTSNAALFEQEEIGEPMRTVVLMLALASGAIASSCSNQGFRSGASTGGGEVPTKESGTPSPTIVVQPDAPAAKTPYPGQISDISVAAGTAPYYIIPSQLTCFAKASSASVTSWLWIGGTGKNGGKTQTGHFYQQRSTGALENKYGNIETRFLITIDGVQQTYYLGSTVPVDPTHPVIGMIQYHIPFQGPYGDQVIEENILDSQVEVDIRRYFGAEDVVDLPNSRSGRTGYWPISIGRDNKPCRSSDDPTWPVQR